MEEDDINRLGPVSYDISDGTIPLMTESPNPNDHDPDHDNELFITNTSVFLRNEENIPTLPRFTPSIRSGMTKFFNNQPDFDIRNTSVVTAAASPVAVQGIDEESREAVIDGLCDMQRTLALASTLHEFRALVSSDLTSAFKIASMTVNELFYKTSAFQLSMHNANEIHGRATTISNRNQSALTSLHQAVRGSGMAAIDGTDSRKDRLRILGEVSANTVKNINLEELFGAMDSDPCDDCNSVTSPAAYFVEILQFLRNNNLDPKNKFTQTGKPEITGTVLERLFARRPDLGNLQLTCPNTTAILPYIDIANEVMESFVVHLDTHTFDDAGNITKAELDVYNSSGTAGELLSEPQNTNFDAYEILSTKLYPFHKLPYNQALDEVRVFLGHLGTSRYSLLETCRSGGETAAEEIDGTRAMVAEYLHLTHEEYSALAGVPCRSKGPEMLDDWRYWGYNSEKELVDDDESTHTGLRFITAQFLPRSGIQFIDLVNLLKTEYINSITDIAAETAISISNPGEREIGYRLVRPGGKLVNIADYSRLRQFIHLWQRIGWTIDETDKAICALSKPAQPAAINPDVLEQLVSILKLLEITKLERPMLLTFWSPISMQGPDSLYYRLFLSNGATRADPVLKLDENGEFNTSAKISQHEALVMATLGLTKEGLEALKGTVSNDELTIPNLTILYRHSLMAKFLDVTPKILLESIKMFGDPFLSPTSCLEFVELWNRMENIGFTFVQLKYVVNGVDDPGNPLGFSDKKIQAIIMSLLPNEYDLSGTPIALSTEKPQSEKRQIMKQLNTDLIVTTLSNALHLNVGTTSVLLSNLGTGDSYGLPIDISMRPREKEMAFKSLMSLLSRASVLISGFKLSPAEATCVLGNKAGFSGFTKGVISLDGWKRLLAYIELRNTLPKGVDETLLDLLQWEPLSNSAEGVKKISNLMLIKEETVQSLMIHLGPSGNDSFQDVNILTKLMKAIKFAKLVGVDVPSLLSWAGTVADFRNTHKVAQEIRSSIRARFTEGDWEKIVKPLQDRLRQNQREALIAYLLIQPALAKWGVIDADSLFEFFLIDVQMGPCFETSRIKQAISTVQVFVQRCFCGLEERYGVLNHTLDEKRWVWMKNYRVWEANRKVFLYPENWLDPSLRDNKSPFFLEFEADLMKKSLDSETMKDAVKSYISNVENVTDLLPVSFVAEGTRGSQVVHLFARTRSTPCVFYYRQFDWRNYQPRWRPWEKMEVDVQYHDDPDAVGQGGVFLSPAVIEGRLIIFTPEIVKMVKDKESFQVTDSPPERVQYFEIKLGCSEYQNGKWTPKRRPSEAVRWKSWQSFTASVIPGETGGYQVGSLTKSHSVRQFRFPVTDRSVKVYLTGMSNEQLIGKFEFKGVCCTVTDNEEWEAQLVDKSRYFGSSKEAADVLAEWEKSAREGTGFEFDMETKNGDKALTFRSIDWSICDNPPTLVYVSRSNLSQIPLTRESTGLLTLTSPSATLDQIYIQLHAAVVSPPSNELCTPFGLYDWELGVHAPMLLMDRLADSHQYDEALEIARFVFNPLAASSGDPSPLRVWKWAPFGIVSTQESFSQLLYNLRPNEANEKINDWRNNPFLPHAVARGRPVAYMKWIVMRYIKILIAAGDQLFRRATMESMPLAIQYYIMAAHLYGPPTQETPKHTKTAPKSFNTLITKWDAFSNAMVTFENAFPFTDSISGGGEAGTGRGTGLQLGYFCIPTNPAIKDLRTLIDDRLYKIRHSQDINGITQKLALFEPPIDPGLLVRQASGGLGLESVLDSISGPMPNYRFQYLLRGALDMVQELKSLTSAFLGAQERKDSESYQQIRAGHESTINAVVLGMKKLGRDEANRALDSLRDSRDGPLCRLNHFLQLIGQDVVTTASKKYEPVQYGIERPTGDLMKTRSENQETALAEVASYLRVFSTALAATSATILVAPTPEVHSEPMGVGVSVRAGPVNVAEGIRASGLAAESTATFMHDLSDAASRTNSFVRQYQDRILQANSAGHELNSINAQIKIQEVRVSIVEKDIELQEKQIETDKATEEFLRTKYTNEALYSWQETQLRTLHYQTYTVAYDLAKKVEKSYQFERGLTDSASNFIVSTWDSGRDGLLSAETLGLGLRRLESAYQESRGHDFEITKHISLRQIKPKALLQLRSTNSCEFSLPETLFDMDFPGHHTRRLKSVSLSLPCVVGPYTSVNCTLELTKHSYRLGAAGDPTEQEVNYVPIHSVAFSSAQNDPGVFELNFHDERYLPFEGAGVISSWNLSLPKFSSFDYQTISDVILHLRYTSIAGPDTTASARLKMHLAAGKAAGSEIEGALYASFDLRNEFASTWQQLGSGQPMTLSNLNARLPWWTTKHQIEVVEIQLLTSTAANFTPSEGNPGFVFQIQPDNEEAKGAQDGGLIDGITTFTIDTGITKFETWKLTMTKQEFSLTDLWMVVQYKAMTQ